MPRAVPGAITIPVKLAYGLGQLVEGVSTTVYGTFLFFLYTALMGLPGSLVGAATAIALVVDAAADPMLGSWSDNTRSRWGRRIPFMTVGAPVVALGIGLALSPPTGLSSAILFAWLLICSLILRFAVSVFNVPFVALGAELSEDYAERSSIVAWRSLFSILGSLLVIILAYGVFLAGPHGLLNRAGYLPLAWSGAAIVLLGGVVSTVGVRRFAAGLPLRPRDDTAMHRRFVGELAEVFRNPSFRVLFATVMLFFVAQGVASALGQHMNNFVWRMSSSEILMVTLALFAGLVVGLPLTPLLSRRFEKRGVVMAGLIMLCLAQGVLPGLRAAGVFMLSGKAVVTPLALNTFFAGIGVAIATVSFASMMADAADEHDFLFRTRREGLYFAGLGFAGKAATGLGALVAGVGLEAIRFPSLVGGQTAKPIGEPTLAALVVVAGPLVAATSLAATLILLFYRIDRKRHVEVVNVLRARREA
jgi:GPH family glycoside/pentoside/hexuronide:cation symporter